MTENVAVLFTDMVASTAMASGLTQDAADALRREHFSILREAVAETGGTEVKNLGDGIMVVFTSTSGALSCAVAMQQKVERDNRAREDAIGLRIGLSVGEVIREEGDYFGDPVIEASRLCAMCEGGQILAADLARLMAGRRSRHEYDPVGPLALKGIPEPVLAVAVRWEPLGPSANAVPLPGRLSLRPSVGVVGRRAEIATMAEAFERVARGEGREVLLVSGEAGVGKTTLVAEAARSFFEAGACVLFAHCEEDLAHPYQLFVESLGHYVEHAADDELSAGLGADASELARLVPTLATRLPELPRSKATDADTERYLLFAAVVRSLKGMSRQQPVVLVFDDLQWADKASLQLLLHVTAAEPAIRLLVLGTYRDDELSRSHPLLETLAAFHRQRGVSRLEVTGLDAAGVFALMEAAAGQSLDAAAVGLAEALYRETDGNPFFVSEVLIHLTESGAIYQDTGGRWVAKTSLDDTVLPDSLREVIGARVGRLGAGVERVLSLAAVIGRDFDLAVLARATEASEDDLLDVLDAAASVALVRELAGASGRYSFTHALIQRALYDEFGPTRRAGAHRRVAEALEHLCGQRPGERAGELARHWLNATAPDNLAKAIGYSRQAGDAALAALAPADALGYYAQALAMYDETDDPDPLLRLDLAIGLGTAQRQTGDAAFHETLLDAGRRATALGDTDRLVTAALAGDRGFVANVGVIDADKVEMLELALARLPADHPDRALVLANLCQELTYGSRLERRQTLADEALDIARRVGDDTIMVRVLNSVFLPLLVPSLLQESLARSADALVRAERLGDPVLLHWAASGRLVAAARAGDIDEWDRCYEINRSLADRLDQPQLKWWHSYARATRAQIAGDTAAAEAFATEALEFGTGSGQPDADRLFTAQMLVVSYQRGTLGGLIPIIGETADDAPEISPAFVGSLLALAYVEADRTDDARRVLETFAANHFELPPDPVWLTGMLNYAEAAIQCRDPRYAGPLFERLAPWADQFSTTGVTAEGAVSAALGGLAAVLDRYDEASGYFTQAAAFNERANAKFFAARTNLSWAMMLAERNAPGDLEKARSLVTEARATAAAHGYANVEHRAAVVLQRLT